MKFGFEKSASPQEGEQNPEIDHQLEELDGEAGEVADQLEEADLEDMEPEDRSKLRASLEVVFGTIFILGGVAVSGMDTHLGDIRPEVLQQVGHTIQVTFGAVSAMVGIMRLIKGYKKFQEAEMEQQPQ